MGSYSYINFAGYPLFENKNSYHEEIVSLLFHSKDFKSERRKNSSRNKLIWGNVYNDDDDYTFKGFSQTVKICKQRLEIYGNSRIKSEKDFQKAKIISEEERFYNFSLQQYTYDKYISEIGDIIDKKEIEFDTLHQNFRDSLISDNLGINGQHYECQIYSILSVLPDNAIIEYDLTEIIEGGHAIEEIVRNVEFEKIIVFTEGKTDVEFI